jgi:mannose-1-phosphate guanylyltransferase
LNPPPFSRALVLTAGLGTRLRPLTLVRAKAAVPVDGEALGIRVIRWLAANGVRDLVLNLHHKPETITRAVGDGSDLGVRVRYSWEGAVLGSAGGPRHALPLLLDGGPATLLLVNGDTLTDVSLEGLARAHRAAGGRVTMALIPNPRPDKYGGVVLDPGGAVTGFTKRGSGVASFHFVGVQAVEPEVFATLEDGVFAESVLEVYIGTPSDLLTTSLALAAADGRPDAPRAGRDARVAASADVGRSLLWDGVRVGEHAVLHDCIVADGVEIGPRERFERRVIVLDPGAGRIVQAID